MISDTSKIDVWPFLNARKWMTTGIGLGVIPFIVHPIDSLVHYGMDNTTRKWIGGADVKLD